jgi:hypothetical protein
LTAAAPKVNLVGVEALGSPPIFEFPKGEMLWQRNILIQKPNSE